MNKQELTIEQPHELMVCMAVSRFVSVMNEDDYPAIFLALREDDEPAYREFDVEANAPYVDWDFDSLSAAVSTAYDDLDELSGLVRAETVAREDRLELIERMAVCQYVTGFSEGDFTDVFKALIANDEAAFKNLDVEAFAQYSDWGFDSLSSAVSNACEELQSLCRKASQAAKAAWCEANGIAPQAGGVDSDEITPDGRDSAHGLSLSLNPTLDIPHDLMVRMAVSRYVTTHNDGDIAAVFDALIENEEFAFYAIDAEVNAAYKDWDFDSLSAAVSNAYDDLQELSRKVSEATLVASGDLDALVRRVREASTVEVSLGGTRSTAGLSLCLNAATWYEQPDFQAWLESAEGLMSWHTPGQPVGEFTDIVVFVDPSLNGEGVQDGMPDAYWKAVVDHCKAHFSPGQTTHHISVVIKNL